MKPRAHDPESPESASLDPVTMQRPYAVHFGLNSPHWRVQPMLDTPMSADPATEAGLRAKIRDLMRDREDLTRMLSDLVTYATEAEERIDERTRNDLYPHAAGVGAAALYMIKVTIEAHAQTYGYPLTKPEQRGGENHAE